MYKEWIKKYSGWFILGLLLIAAYKLFDELIAVTNLFVGLVSILKPFIIGAVLAYFIYIPSIIIEKKLEKSNYQKVSQHARILSVLLTYFAFLAIMITIIMFLIPVVRNNIIEISDKIPVYAVQIQNFINDLIRELDLPTNFHTLIDVKFEDMLMSIFNFKNFEALDLINRGVGVVNAIYTAFMSIVICPYILAERESLLRIFDRVIGLFICERDIRFIHRYANKINRIFSNFIFGKALDSSIIGIIALVAFRFMNLKFDVLFALVIMVTNMIPYFGPFIGGIPVTLIAGLTMGVTPGIWTGIFIICLQQFDGLILGPYILGESVGVNALWIIFAITFFGGTMGFIGMFIGVPLIAVIRMIFNDVTRFQDIKTIIRKSDILK